MNTTTPQKSLLTDPAKLEVPKTVAGMLYGQPGSRKTTTALSAPKPVLLDFDRGLHRIKPQWRVPSLQVENYQQVLDLLAGDELNPFETVVIDTGGKLVDAIIAWCIKRNPKDGNGRGQPSQQGWGSVKAEFGAFVKMVKASGKSVIFVAHESEEKNGDETIKRPDIAGSARKDVTKELDFMGYMEMRGGTPVINFSPTDKFYAKNSMSLDDAVEVPTLQEGQPNDFLSRYLFKAAAAKVEADNALRKQYEDLIFEIEAALGSLKTLDDVNAFYTGTLPKLEERAIWDSTFVAKNALRGITKTLGMEFDTASKLFVQKPQPEAKAEDKPAKGKAAKKAEAAPVAKAEGEASAGHQAQVASASEAAPAGAEPSDADIDKAFSE